MIFMFIYLMLLHWFGDFVFQTEWMAENKSKCWWALIFHVFVYTMTIMIGVTLTGNYYAGPVIGFGMVNYAIHFIVDAITSMVNKDALEKKNFRMYYAVIGFDQFIHNVTLLITFDTLLGMK